MGLFCPLIESVAADLLVRRSVAILAKADTTNWDEQVAAFEVGKATFGRIDYGTSLRLAV